MKAFAEKPVFVAWSGILARSQRATEARVYFCTLFCSRRCHTVGVTVAGPRALKSGRVRPAWLFFFPFVLTIQGPCVSTECEDQLFHFCKKAHWNFLFLSQGCPKARDCFGGNTAFSTRLSLLIHGWGPSLHSRGSCRSSANALQLSLY